MDAARVEQLRQQMERAMARRIHPHYVHDFFIEAFRRLGGKVNPREKGRYEITYVPPLLLDRNQQIGVGVPVQGRYERICFEKEHVADSPRAELVSPGHPLLEACISLVLERDGSVLGQGAVLIDERDLGSEPRLLFCLEHGLQDGRKTRAGQQQLISNRLQFLEISRSGVVSPAGSAPYLDYRPLRDGEQELVAPLLQESWLTQDWDALVLQHAMTTLVPRHLEEVSAERLERIAKAEREIKARKRVELLAMNAVFEAEKALGRMPKDVSAERGRGYDIESIDADSNLFFIEVKGRADGADTVTLTINEVNTGRNAPHRFRLALVSVAGDQAAAPVYVSGVDWGLPGFGDTQITKNLQQLLAAGRAPH
jgi:hypothetical protein